MKDKSLTGNQIQEIADSIPWFGVTRIRHIRAPHGGIFYDLDDSTFTLIGPDLLSGFLFVWRELALPIGHWAVECWLPRDEAAELPDWGCLTVRGPGSWCLRSRDGRQAWASGRAGTVICLRAGGSQ